MVTQNVAGKQSVILLTRRPSEGETKSVEFDLPQTIQLAFSSCIINVAHTINVWITHSLDFVLLLGPPIAVPITIGNVPFHGQQTAVLDPAQPVPTVNLSPPGGLPPSNVSGYPPQGPAGPEGAVQPLATPEPSTVQATAQPISAGNLSSPQGPLPANVPQAQAGYPPQGLPEPNTVQATASLPTELQSQAPPPYGFAVSEPKV